MTRANVSFAGNDLTVGELSWRVDYPILQAFLLGEKVIVLYDPDTRTETFGQFPNLLALAPRGRCSGVVRTNVDDFQGAQRLAAGLLACAGEDGHLLFHGKPQEGPTVRNGIYQAITNFREGNEGL